MKKNILYVAAALTVAALAGCGDWEPPAGWSEVEGQVIQGPVAGAKVFADKDGDGILDNGERWTTTGPDGKFTLLLPDDYGAYQYVTVPGTGTDTTTGLPGVRMVAPSDYENITPISTLVAMSPGSEAAILAALGLTSADVDISTAPSAVVAVAKSFEATLTALQDVPALSANPAVLAELQLKVAEQFALQLAANAGAATDPDALATALQNAVQDAIGDVEALATTDAGAVGTQVNTLVTTVATAVETAAGGTLANTGTVDEADIADTIEETLEDAIDNATDNIDVVVTPPTGSTGGTGGTGTGGNN